MYAASLLSPSENQTRTIWALNRRRWFCWWPVGVGVGVWLFFGLDHQHSDTGPLLAATLAVGALFLLLYGITTRGGYRGRRHRLLRGLLITGTLVAGGLTAVMAGWSAANWRVSRAVQTYPPMLSQEVGPLSAKGVVESADVSPHGHVYIFQIEKYYPWRKSRLKNGMGQLPQVEDPLPKRIRLIVPHRRAEIFDVGQQLYLPAVKLLPLAMPLSRHDHRRLQAFLDGVGGRGIAFSLPQPARLDSPSTPSSPPMRAPFLTLEKVRHHIAQFLYQALPGHDGQGGAIAAALLTGKKSALSKSTLETFANAGLSHLLAISGLHLTLMASLIYGFLLLVFRCYPPLLLRYPVHQWALMAAMVGAGGYAILSGWAVPVQRSYIMLLVFMGGMLLYRQPFSLRSVALAATLILLVRPETMLGISFQLSFASVVGLIAFYDGIRPWFVRHVRSGFMRYGVTLVLSSIVAGLVTLPFTAFYFHKFSLQSVAANLVAIPLTGFVLLPTGVLLIGFCALGFSADSEVVGLLGTLMGWGLDKLIVTAQQVGQWPGARMPVVEVDGWFLALNVMGLLWLCLWRGWVRWLGLILCGISLVFLGRDAPLLRISQQGDVLALYDRDTVWVTTRQVKRFEQQTWQESHHRVNRRRWFKGNKRELPGHLPDLGRIILRGHDDQGGQVLDLPDAGLTCQFKDDAYRWWESCTLWPSGQRIHRSDLLERGGVAVYAKKNYVMTGSANYHGHPGHALIWAWPSGRQKPWLN